MRRRDIAATVAVLTACFGGTLLGQPPAGQAGRGGPRGPEPLPFEDHAGFVSIFDGSTLKGWDGDTKFWRADGGAIVGQTTAENPLKENSFIIWRGGEPADFELKVEYRINATNSGIQIRSVRLPPGTQQGRGAVAGNWVLKGYQCDIDAENRFTGQIYEERGRGFLAMRGQFSYIGEGKKAAVVGSVGDSEELKKLIKGDDWNDLHLIARGNTIIQLLNGRITSMVIDDDTAGRKLDGLIGIQCHLGPPMKIEVRNVRLKKL